MMRLLVAVNASGATSTATSTEPQAASSACVRASRNTLTTQCYSACSQASPICVNYAARPSNESQKEGDGNYYYQGCAYTNMATCHASVGTAQCEIQCLQTKNQNNTDWVLDVGQPQADRIETSLFVAVDKLQLPASLRTLKLAGTTELTRKVPVSFEAGAFSSGTGLQSLSLVNIGVSSLTSNIFPASLTSLTIWRTSLSEFDPLGGSALTNLRVLNLNENNLTSIPLAVYDLASLSELYLEGNPISNAHVTSSQLAFLRGLDVFNASIKVDGGCRAGFTLYNLNGNSVCYGEDGLLSDSLNGTIPQSDDSSGSRGSSKTSTMGLVILGSAVFVVVLAIITGMVLLKRAKKRKDEARRSIINDEPPKQKFKALATYKPNDLINPLQDMATIRSPVSRKMTFRDIPASDVQVLEVVVQTSAMTVLHGVFNKRKVLVNRLHVSEDAAENCETALSVTPVVSQLRHPQLLTVVGFMWEDAHSLSAVCEDMDRGTLEDYLLTAAGSLTWRNFKLKAALDIAGCLMFLHGQSHRLTYDGLSARTVFVDSRKGCKLSTMMASLPNGVVKSDQAKSTRSFCAPEVMAGEPPVAASDMYAFGVLLAQLDTCETAEDMIRSSLRQRSVRDLNAFTDSNASGSSLHEESFTASNSSRDSRTNSVSLSSGASLLSMFSFRNDCPEVVKDLAHSCLQIDPSMRPSAQYVSAMLQHLL